MYRELEYTKVTDGITEIDVPYIETSVEPNYKKYGTLCTGLVIKTSAVHSVCYGRVLSVHKESDNTLTILVQYNKDTCFRYRKLSEVFVESGNTIRELQVIGCTLDTFLFEYLTQEKSKWAIRVDTSLYFNHDPEPVLEGKVDLTYIPTENTYTFPMDAGEFSGDKS